MKTFLKRNTSTILTCVGAGGVVATTVLAVKATPRALQILEKAKHNKGEELTKVEQIKVAAPAYIPTIIVGISTIGCIVGANALNKRQQASMASAYALLNSSYKEYKNKVVDLYGPEKDEEIKDEIAKDNIGEVKASKDKQLFYDEFSKQYFESTIADVQKAEYYLNRDLTMRDYAYLNEFYESLKIPLIETGWTLGWSVGSCLDMYWQPWIDFNHSRFTLENGEECIRISIFQEPIVDFEEYF